MTESQESLEQAAKQANLEIEPGSDKNAAMIKSSSPHTPEGLLSGKPILLAKLIHGNKPNFYTISFKDQGSEDVAILKDLTGHVKGTYPATLYVPRHSKNSSTITPLGFIGGPGCWASSERGIGVTVIRIVCGKVNAVIVIAD